MFLKAYLFIIYIKKSKNNTKYNKIIFKFNNKNNAFHLLNNLNLICLFFINFFILVSLYILIIFFILLYVFNR